MIFHVIENVERYRKEPRASQWPAAASGAFVHLICHRWRAPDWLKVSLARSLVLLAL